MIPIMLAKVGWTVPLVHLRPPKTNGHGKIAICSLINIKIETFTF